MKITDTNLLRLNAAKLQADIELQHGSKSIFKDVNGIYFYMLEDAHEWNLYECKAQNLDDILKGIDERQITLYN